MVPRPRKWWCEVTMLLLLLSDSLWSSISKPIPASSFPRAMNLSQGFVASNLPTAMDFIQKLRVPGYPLVTFPWYESSQFIAILR